MLFDVHNPHTRETLLVTASTRAVVVELWNEGSPPLDMGMTPAQAREVAVALVTMADAIDNKEEGR